jgi:hypothetical protein
MKNSLAAIGLLLVSVAPTACTQFSTTREVLSPSAPALPGGSSDGPLVGTWTAPTDLTLPAPSSCRNFEWSITSQSPTAIVGSFRADCGGGVAISANASGNLTSANTVTISVIGSGFLGSFTCPFNLSSNATIIDDYTLDTPYSGTTCFGPVSGHQTLRRPRPAPPTPEPSPEPPPPPPPPGESPFHVGPGPLDEGRAGEVIYNTSYEFPELLAVFGSEGEAVAHAEVLLRRTIWHLHRAGYQAARQRNPSGAISHDKVNIIIGGVWRTYDIYTLGYAGVATRVTGMNIVCPDLLCANPIPDDGIPD